MSPTEQSIFIFAAALFVISAAIFVLASIGSRNGFATRELWYLYWSEFLIVGGIVIPAFWGGYPYLGVLLLFSIRAQFEFYTLQGLNSWALPQLVGFMAGCTLVLTLYFLPVADPYQILWLVCMLGLVTWLIRSTSLNKNGARTAFVSVLFPASLIATLGQIQQHTEGFALLLFVYIIVETNDAFASLCGKLFGRTRIFPKLSPHKTLGGLVCGVSSAIAVGVVLNHYIYHFDFPSVVGVILLIIGSGIAGDLFFSKLKRNRGVKDFPPIMSGHGGLLDIYDSLFVAAPVFFILGLALLE
uniref:Cytidylyltransferase family protein n=1 Tax=Candidatus Kentrum sp. FW TaxID=2126338 RepID=A0A450TGX6_9GAMM|nr:MAG: Cytidylyltransferase family protein [Candidatus Kentron sp. FW]VFJ66449.1 MAG: Cytidylyltransferase family protein [Candidatus Kentron sp. FW]